MPSSFSMLSRSEKTEFWQKIASTIKEALRQCEHQLPVGVTEDVSEYLEHNELGLAWETLCGELINLEGVPSASAQQMILEAGIRMGFNEAGSQNHALLRKIASLFSCVG